MWAGEKIPVEFELKTQTCLTQGRLWNQFEQAMVDSKPTWIWPQNRSSVVGTGLVEESLIEVTYRTTFSSPTYVYRLKNVVDNRRFRYQAVKDQHPFKGGADIAISTRKMGLSFLGWDSISQNQING